MHSRTTTRSGIIFELTGNINKMKLRQTNESTAFVNLFVGCFQIYSFIMSARKESGRRVREGEAESTLPRLLLTCCCCCCCAIAVCNCYGCHLAACNYACHKLLPETCYLDFIVQKTMTATASNSIEPLSQRAKTKSHQATRSVAAPFSFSSTFL